MIVNGNEITAEIKKELTAKVLTFAAPPQLTVFYDEDNTVGSIYVGRKEAFAKEIKVAFQKIAFGPDETTEQVVERLIAQSKIVDGIVLQLPLPSRLDTDAILNALPPEVDVDVVSTEGMRRFAAGVTPLLPPVVAAIKIIADQYSVHIEGAHAVVVGEGRLVGRPAATWLHKKGARVVAVNEKTPDITALLKTADIIVLGAGAPGLLTPDMVKPNAAIFDAGSTIVEGRVRGDADPSCTEVATVFTPTPGGIGPMSIACAFRNLILLTEESSRKGHSKH